MIGEICEHDTEFKNCLKILLKLMNIVASALHSITSADPQSKFIMIVPCHHAMNYVQCKTANHTV